MTDKIKIGIGAPTYNSIYRLERFLSSIELYRDSNYEYKIVILDDGTPNIEKRDGILELAARFDVDFIQHERNEGIPKSWNDLTRHFSTEISFLFNDDICICNENWMKCAIYALEQNDKVAVVGYPLIQIDPATGLPNINYSLPNLDSSPGRVGAVVGCAFAFKRKAFDEVNGFDENIKSFYEETDFGFKLAQLGYYSVMLPFPPIEHCGSQSFGQNIDICIQQPIEEILSMQEYKEIMSKKFPMERIEPFPNVVYRMDYSRVYFAHKWGCSDLWNAPQIEVHHRVVDPLPKIKFKYLNKDIIEMEHEI